MLKEKIKKMKERALLKVNNLASSKYRTIIVAAYGIFIISSLGDLSFATAPATPGGGSGLFTKAGGMIEEIRSSLLGFSMAAAGLGICIGAFMKKFSFGDGGRVGMGNKLIRDSLIAFGVANGANLLLTYIQGKVK